MLWYFYKSTPELCLNYILVSVILHLRPCLSFYNYDYISTSINLIYINYLFKQLNSNHYNFLTIAPF
jgi:hypothetical protein